MHMRPKTTFPLFFILIAALLMQCHRPAPNPPPTQEPIGHELPKNPANSKPTTKLIEKSPNKIESSLNDSSETCPFQLPPKWSGTGIVTSSKEFPYKGSPHWGKRIQVEIVQTGDNFYLRATSGAENISNINLLRQTATNRARALLQETLQRNRLTHSQIVRTWKNPNRAEMIVQVQTPIPAQWAHVAPAANTMKDSSL